MSKKIFLTRGKFAIVDDEDFVWLSQWKWQAIKFENVWYARRSDYSDGKNKPVYMHRALLGKRAGPQTDHLNRNGLDNRKENLTPCIHQANRFNKDRSNLTSEFFGVSFNSRSKKWCADIKRYGKTKHIGAFKSEVDAARAYNTEAFKIHGTSARLNHVDE